MQPFIFHVATTFSGPGPPLCRGFTITVRNAIVFRTSLDEWSSCRTDLRLTTHNCHNKQTSMLPAEFEPAAPTSERPPTHDLDRAAAGIGKI